MLYYFLFLIAQISRFKIAKSYGLNYLCLMAGIYLHIPFCKQACTYCNFHFSTSLKLKNEVLEAIMLELKIQKNYLEEEDIETVYFGGGTPSLLTADEINRITDVIQQHYQA